MKILSKLSNYYSKYYKKIKPLYKLIFVILVLFYFTYHAIAGANGYRSYLVIKSDVQKKQSIYDDLLKEFNFLKNKVELLSDKSIDLDLLEERCRIILNYSLPEDIVVRYKNHK